MGTDPAPVGRPLGAYATLAGVLAGGTTAALVALERSGRRIPERIGWGDVVLYGMAVHKASRLLSKDRVTAFARAPFTRLQENVGHGEVEEAAVGTGARRALGELLVCPPCLGVWVAAGFGVGAVAAPRPTRLVAAMLATVLIADLLHIAYKAAEERQEP